MIKYISLDLQGTLSKSTYSDNFWINILPMKYAEKFNISLEESKQILKEKFKEYGVYNILYYDDNYWAKYLNFDTKEELNKNSIKPEIDQKLYDYIMSLKLPKIIISTTTNLFINLELENRVNDFYKIYSCVDYFKTGGKTTKIYENVCKELNVKPDEILHIGDNKLMDIDNATLAGIQTIFYDGNSEDMIDKIKRKLEE